MWDVFCGAAIFAAGGFFGILVLGLAQAAAKEMPKPPARADNLCSCGFSFKPGIIHSDTGPCYVKEV